MEACSKHASYIIRSYKARIFVAITELSEFSEHSEYKNSPKRSSILYSSSRATIWFSSYLSYRELLLAFIVSNNLPMSLVNRPSFRQLIHQLSPSTLAISTSSLMRDLHKTFCNYRMKLQIELQAHVVKGGRLSLTIDSWSAMNGGEHAAITVHWINNEWAHRYCVLDIIHLKEPIHSGEYLVEQLQAVTD